MHHTQAPLNTDLMRAGSTQQLPPDVQGLRAEIVLNSMVPVRFFGLQYILDTLNLKGVISRHDVVSTSATFTAMGSHFPQHLWTSMLEETGSILPLRIRAIPEGAIVQGRIPVIAIECEHPKYSWLVDWFAAALSRVAFPSAVATLCGSLERIIEQGLIQSVDDPDHERPYKFWDHSTISATSRESADIATLAFLTSFKVTTNPSAMGVIRQHYTSNRYGEVSEAPVSIHPNYAKLWGRDRLRELVELTISKHIDDFGRAPSNIYIDATSETSAVVKAIRDQKILDILDKRTVLTLKLHSSEDFAELASGFESTVNTKGYRVLNKLRFTLVGMPTVQKVAKEVQHILSMGYSLTNVSFGLGKILSQVNVTTFPLFQYISGIKTDGEWQAIEYRQRFNTLAGGNVAVIKDDNNQAKDDDGKYFHLRSVDKDELLPRQEIEDLLTLVYSPDKIIRVSWEEIEANKNLTLNSATKNKADNANNYQAVRPF